MSIFPDKSYCVDIIDYFQSQQMKMLKVLMWSGGGTT
jgi:hypothetical protein